MRKEDYVILVDMDDTMEDLQRCWVTYLNSKYDLHVDATNITNWEMPPYFPSLTEEQVYEVLVEEELWKTVTPIEGSITCLQKLIEEGFTVRVCTASSPTSYALKMKHVMKRYFPFINTRTQCICIHDKQMIKADILLDDNPNNLIGGSYKGVLFSRRTNVNADYPIRVNSWDEFYEYVQKDFFLKKNKKFLRSP